ncbi:MAG TPA: hypothetical protein VF188_01785 [Longimicrobiales bacterium]
MRFGQLGIPARDEPFAVDDKVVGAYTLEAEKRGGGKESTAVMAIRRLADGKVKSLRER